MFTKNTRSCAMDYRRGREDLKLDNRTKLHLTHTNMHTYITHIALCVHTDMYMYKLHLITVIPTKSDLRSVDFEINR